MVKFTLALAVLILLPLGAFPLLAQTPQPLTVQPNRAVVSTGDKALDRALAVCENHNALGMSPLFSPEPGFEVCAKVLAQRDKVEAAKPRPMGLRAAPLDPDRIFLDDYVKSLKK